MGDGKERGESGEYVHPAVQVSVLIRIYFKDMLFITGRTALQNSRGINKVLQVKIE